MALPIRLPNTYRMQIPRQVEERNKNEIEMKNNQYSEPQDSTSFRSPYRLDTSMHQVRHSPLLSDLRGYATNDVRSKKKIVVKRKCRTPYVRCVKRGSRFTT